MGIRRAEVLQPQLQALLFLVFGVLILGMPQGCREQRKESPHWNIVLILADDLGWNQVGYHGTRFYETPNIDGIAAAGMQFSDAYSANPVCSPTRASLMTGKNPARLHLTDYIPGSPYPYARLTTPKMAECLPLEEITLAEMLKEQGYVTGHFGKWHLSPDKNYQPGRPFDPASQGFDEVFTSVKPPPDADPDKDAHHTMEITRHSLEFMDKYRDKPFFLYVSYHAVHRPIMETKELIAEYQAKPASGDPVNNPIMGAMIERMDTAIGEILQRLDELSLSDKTIVIFYSDNGGFEELQDQAPLRGGKAMIWEGGVRVPLAIRWPGVVAAGSKSSQPVISDDFFPTLAEITGYDDLPQNIDGVSLVPLLKQSGPLNREALFFHYPHYHHLGYKPGGAVRQGDYKLIEWYEEALTGEEKAVQLYNLRQDIGETNDLSEEMPEKAAELQEKLHRWREAVQAQEMTTNPDYDPLKADQRFKEESE